MQRIKVSVAAEPHHEGLEMPRYQSDLASGLDLVAAVDQDMVLKKGKIALVPTGLKISIPEGYEAQVRPRSGLALKNGITVVNSPGTIDADYRGEVKIILGNLGDEDFTISRGMRIAQLVFQQVVHASFEKVDELDETTRGEGGFGSSGVHNK